MSDTTQPQQDSSACPGTRENAGNLTFRFLMPPCQLTSLTPIVAATVAILVGVAIPLRASGVVPEQAALGLALLGSLLITYISPEVRRRFRLAVLSPSGAIVGTAITGLFTGVTFSLDPGASAKMAVRTALLLLAVVALWSVLSAHVATHQAMFKALVLSALILAAAVALSLSGVPIIALLLKGKISGLEHPIGAFKAFAASAMCLTPVVAWAGRRLDGKWRWLGYAFAPLALYIIVQTFNRAALAGFLAMTLVGVVLLALARKGHAKALLATTLAGAIAIIFWIHTKESGTIPIQGSYLPEWLIDPHRQHIWKFAFQRFLEHPWVGIGIDQLNHLPGAGMPMPGYFDSTAVLVPSHPHNWALEVLAEGGIIGFIPIIIALSVISWRLVRRYITDHNERDMTLMTLTAGFWVSALFNFSIWATWWQLTFYVLYALVSSYPHSEKTL